MPNYLSGWYTRILVKLLNAGCVHGLRILWIISGLFRRSKAPLYWRQWWRWSLAWADVLVCSCASSAPCRSRPQLPWSALLWPGCPPDSALPNGGWPWCKRTSVSTHIRSRACINYACMRVQTHSCERIRTEARTNVRTNALTYLLTYRWMHARMYTYTRAHAHMHANIYSQDIVTFRRTIVLVVLFSQYLRDLKIPIGKQKSFYLFKLFPVSDNTIV